MFSVNLKDNLKDRLFKIKREAEERDAKKRAEINRCLYVNTATIAVNTEALELIPEDIARKAKAAPIELKDDRLAVAAYEPSSELVQELKKELEARGFKVSLFTASLSSLNYVYGFYKFVSQKKKTITAKIEIGKTEDIEKKVSSLGNLKQTLGLLIRSSGDIADVFEVILAGALANRASDIHIEPAEEKINLRLRIDGVLNDVFGDFKKIFYLHLLSRLKLLSNLKLNVHDKPQDGRFTIDIRGRKIEVRVAVAPSEFGEVAVMRILDPAAISLSLADLGLREDDLKIIETELKRPNGMILNTGPTGSGKTTTLYAFLKHKKSQEIKIITIEDPIEYHLEGIEQTQVDEEADYTFANGLRSLMRQDPDIILIGELRDTETAEIGVQAALTGHLVFSTIHANSAIGAIPRLLDLDVKPTSIGPALNLVIAQRLVRRLCGNCKVVREISAELKNKIERFLKNLPPRVNKDNFKEIKIFDAKEDGCEKCNNSGYKGRVAIYELLLNDPNYEKLVRGEFDATLSSHEELEELILKQAGESAIKKFAAEQGMVALQQDGVLKIISGITTFEEVEAATGMIEGF